MSQTANKQVATDGWRVWGAVSALVLATVIAVVTFALTSDGEGTSQAAGNDVAPVAPTTTAALPEAAPPSVDEADVGPPEAAMAEEPADPAETAETIDLPAAPAALGGGDTAGFEAGMRSAPFAAANEITNMGPTEVGFTTNFSTVDYIWQRIELEGPGLSHQGWLGFLDEQLVAITPSWGGPWESDGQSLATNISADGVTWEQAGTYAIPDDMWIGHIVSDGEQVYAFAQVEEPMRTDTGVVVFVSADGVDWSMVEVPIALEDDEHVYVHNSAAGPAGVLVALNLDTYPDEPPRTLVFDEFEVTLDYARSTFVLSDGSTGEELMSGRLDDLFHWGGDGQTIWNPDTGEAITTVPWEVWERAWSGYYGGGSPLPLPISQPEVVADPTLTVEYDGYVITVDERGGTFSVADAESGDEVTSGTLDELYQGPAPTFVDPETGETYLSLTWDEWYEAEERSWESVEYPEEDYYYYRSKTALATSADGENWSVEVVSDGDGGHVSFVAATEDGFIARVSSYGEFGDRTSVWTMRNGSWSSTDAAGTDLWLNSVVATDEGLVGVGEGGGGPALWTSTDGVAWSTEFAIVPQDDGSHAWLTSAAADETGTVGALVVKERWGEYQPLVIEQDQYSATFEDGESVLRVTETGSGELVLSLTWQDFEEGDAGSVVTWEDGVTRIDLGNGDVMAIPDDEARAAMNELHSGSNEMGMSVFLSNGSDWVEAVVDAEGSISGATQLFLADGKIFIGGSYWGEEAYYHEAGPSEDTFVLLVGVPAGR